MMMRQLFFGAMDMELHSSKYDAFGTRTVFDVQQEAAKKYTVIPPLPEDRFLCSFGHIFAGGYRYASSSLALPFVELNEPIHFYSYIVLATTPTSGLR
jgi:hypothetical protein